VADEVVRMMAWTRAAMWIGLYGVVGERWHGEERVTVWSKGREERPRGRAGRGPSRQKRLIIS
jgi:hypothetical protein